VVRLVVDPGLQAALHVHRGSRWVNPPVSHEDQRSKRPKKRNSDEKPSNEGSESSCTKLGLGVRVWIFSHISE
jgi:hypothetical protein